MKPSEIIKKSAAQEGIGPYRLASNISKLLGKKLAILMQENDTIFLIIRLGDGLVELHIYTQDNPQTLVNSISNFLKKIKSSQIKKIYGIAFKNPDIMNAFQSLGLNIQKSDVPKYSWSLDNLGGK